MEVKTIQVPPILTRTMEAEAVQTRILFLHQQPFLYTTAELIGLLHTYMHKPLPHTVDPRLRTCSFKSVQNVSMTFSKALKELEAALSPLALIIPNGL
jgi:hypothetical protein